MTDFMTVTAVSTVVQPTTFVKTWVQTETMDKVRLIEYSQEFKCTHPA